MKILEIDQKLREAIVKPENLNDLWTLYNIIREGDEVSARTQRRVILKEGSKGERKTMTLKLRVESISFHEFSNRLRVKGKILEGPTDFVNYGSYHTFNLEKLHKVTIIKEKWSKFEIKRLKESSKFENNFIILLVAIETGLATIALITNFSHKRIATIKNHIPGKRYEQTHRNKALLEFYEDVGKVVTENLKIQDINLMIICGPGNTKDHLIDHLRKNFNISDSIRIENYHASSGTESAIIETLKSKKLANLKNEVKIIQEAELIENILTQFALDADLIVIGIDEVSDASMKGAIKQLLIADIMIRGTSKDRKLKIEEIITNVENSGGTVNIMSTENITGERLVDLGSLVGILRYKL
ncbi:MAG: mRNA surveillance protein pelota [Candidatus Lokiarchaeota archaeon]|nr:mRNA surveillance protein pelota [Candidatus Lokiarchaeota archaeon]